MEAAEGQPTYLKRYAPKGSRMTFSWKQKVGKGLPVEKDKLIGQVLFGGTEQTIPIKSNVTGLITFIQVEPIEAQEDIPAETLVLLRVGPCPHSIIYNGHCTTCGALGLKNHTQKIFDRIPGISASEEYVGDKIKEMTQRGKLILILDLDNTIIHARQVPLDYNYSAEFPEENPSDYFEVCHGGIFKYLVRKRNFLDEFLE